MSIKKTVLSLAIIAGISLGYMPQAKASANDLFAAALIASGMGISTVTRMISDLNGIDGLCKALIASGITLGVIDMLPENTSRQSHIKGGVVIGLIVSTSIALMHAALNANTI